MKNEARCRNVVIFMRTGEKLTQEGYLCVPMMKMWFGCGGGGGMQGTVQDPRWL